LTRLITNGNKIEFFRVEESRQDAPQYSDIVGDFCWCFFFGK